MAASFRWILQLHMDVPKAAKFYSEGLDFTINKLPPFWNEYRNFLEHKTNDLNLEDAIVHVHIEKFNHTKDKMDLAHEFPSKDNGVEVESTAETEHHRYHHR
ncbi:hypothetical protein U1Q18_016369 [Sarracenia purpurea var. burkii]